jgi:DNA repair photolyase
VSALPLLPQPPLPPDTARSAPSFPPGERGISLKPIRPRKVLQPLRGGAWPCAEGSEFSINPYRGCQIGCVYCQARFTHGFMDLGDWWDFERKIFFKEGAPEVLDHELARLDDASIAVGTITDPYQSAEEKLRLTRRILESILRAPGRLRIQITTKSDLILRDLDLLLALAKQGPLSVHITITSVRYELAQALEPGAPSPRRRIEALRRLREAGIPAGVFLMPMIPGVNDARESLEGVAREAKAAGAISLAGAPLLLRPPASEPFFRFLRREYPQLEEAYREAFDSTSRTPEKYREKVRRRLSAVRRAFGLADWPPLRAPRARRERKVAEDRPAAETLRQLEIPGL